MTPFEYVTVLISIILGMGITQIVTGVADLVHQWERIKIYWPHLIWIVVVFFLQIQEWWDTYSLRNFTALRLPTFLFVLLYPINLFILARILFPLASPDAAMDLKDFYQKNYRRFFLWASVLPVLSFLNNVLVTGHPIQTQFVQVFAFASLVFLSARKQLNEWVHKTLAILILTVAIAWLAIMWNDALTSA
jgi:hypothetical protein